MTESIGNVNTGNKKDGESLCLSCGLCCMGIFHTRAHIYSEEDKAITLKIGAEMINEGQTEWFALPCPVYSGKCTVYHERPSVCSKHQCDLLKSVLSDNINPEKAKNILGSMKNVVYELQLQLDSVNEPDDSKEIHHRFYNFFKNRSKEKDTEEFKHKHATMLMNYAIFSFLKNQYFYKP